MRHFIARLFKSTAPARRKPLTFRPRMDTLETREVPHQIRVVKT
jgi:hypothetical protein